jgi:hypothetical protein
MAAYRATKTVARFSQRSRQIAIQYTGTPSTLPSPWLNRDVGSVAAAGSASYTNGILTVNASGADICGTSDEFHYVYQPLSRNGAITTQLTGGDGGHLF